MINEHQIQVVIDPFDLKDLDKQQVTEFVMRTWEGETKEVLIIQGELGTGKRAFLNALRLVSNPADTLFVYDWKPDIFPKVSINLVDPFDHTFHTSDKPIKDKLWENWKKIILTTELDEVPDDLDKRKITKVIMEPIVEEKYQRFSLSLARKLLSQIDEEHAGSSFWIVSVISMLAGACPDMTVEQLLILILQEMPIHSELYKMYTKGSKLFEKKPKFWTCTFSEVEEFTPYDSN